MAKDIFADHERYWNPSEAEFDLRSGGQTKQWNSLPMQVVLHKTADNTAEIKSTIKLAYQKKDGTIEWKEIPKLVDVPVYYPGGGGMSITFPIKPGDEG